MITTDYKQERKDKSISGLLYWAIWSDCSSPLRDENGAGYGWVRHISRSMSDLGQENLIYFFYLGNNQMLIFIKIKLNMCFT